MWMKQKHVYRFWFYYTKNGRLGGKYTDYSVFLDDIYTLYTKYTLVTPVSFLDIKVKFAIESAGVVSDISHFVLYRVDDQEYRQNLAGEKYGFEDDAVKLTAIAVNTLHPEDVNHYLVNPYSMEMSYLSDDEIDSIDSRTKLDEVVRSKILQIKSEAKEQYMKRMLADQGASLATGGQEDDLMSSIVYAEIHETCNDNRLRETMLHNYPQSSRTSFNRPDSCGSLPVYIMGPLMDTLVYDTLKRFSTGTDLPEKPATILVGMSKQYLPPATIKCKTNSSSSSSNGQQPAPETVFVPAELYMGKNREKMLHLCYGTLDRDALDAHTEIAFPESGVDTGLKERLESARKRQELAREKDSVMFRDIFKCYDQNDYVKSTTAARASTQTGHGMFTRRRDFVLASHGNKYMFGGLDDEEKTLPQKQLTYSKLKTKI